jgi:hypothetical protein
MRFSSGSSESISMLFLLLLVSCASAPPSISTSEPFQLEGTIDVMGDQPFDRVIVLSDSEDVRWNLDPGELEAELSLLDGYMARLTCSAVPGRGSERDARVETYVILPPEGMTAVLGRLEAGDVQSLLVGADGSKFRLGGPLSSALLGFGGNRAWIWGRVDGRILEVSGYEILGP